MKANLNLPSCIIRTEITSYAIRVKLDNGVEVDISFNPNSIHVSLSNITPFPEDCYLKAGNKGIKELVNLPNYLDIVYQPQD
jgi:hypothetical protein